MHVCPIDSCLKTFTRKANLDGHINAHFGAQPYQCYYCPTKFTRQNERRVHEREQHGHATGVQTYRCDACGATFPRKATLLRHQRQTNCSQMGEPSRIEDTGQDIAHTKSAPGQKWLVLRCSSATVTRRHFDERRPGLPGSSLTTHKPNADTLYDWTAITFASTLDALIATLDLFTLEDPRAPRYIGDNRIDSVYSEVIRTTITLFTKGPLQLVMPTILSLSILEDLRRNATAAETLFEVAGNISDRQLRLANLSKFSPQSICFPMLVDASERFLARFNEFVISRIYQNEPDFYGDYSWEGFEVSCCFCSLSLASCFATWTQICMMQGLHTEAAICSSLHWAFEPLSRRLLAQLAKWHPYEDPEQTKGWQQELRTWTRL